ncbi:unnamed protein product, partial [Oppiella nova]
RLTRFVEFGRKIVCVGKNYGKHAQEMGGKVPDKPLIFLKPATAYVTEGNPINVVSNDFPSVAENSITR